METSLSPSTREWLTVDQAFLTCQERSLLRTKKTIRQWCRQEHVDCQKQVTPTGERWMLEKASLLVKIAAELEFMHEVEPVQTGANQYEHVQTRDTPVQTGAHAYERGQTHPGSHEEVSAKSRSNEAIAELETKVRSLEIDKAVRDKQVEYLTEQNATAQEQLLGQSRYIGHLETEVLRLDGEASQQFLEAPIPRSQESPETPPQGSQANSYDPVH